MMWIIQALPVIQEKIDLSDTSFSMSYEAFFGIAGIIIAIGGLFFTYKNFMRIKKKEDKESVAELAKIKGDLTYIKDTVDSIKEDVKEINSIKIKVTALEESVKSVWKRVEQLEQRKNKEK